MFAYNDEHKNNNVSIEVFDIIINFSVNHSWLRLNFPRVYKTSFENNNLKDLQQFCAKIISKFPTTIFDSNEFLTLSENGLISVLKLYNLQIDEGKICDYTIRWGIAQNPSLSSNPDQWSYEHFSALKKTLQNCLSLIRYLQISDEDIIEKVRPYQKIFDPTLWTDIQNNPPRIYLPTTLLSRDDKALKIKSIKASELRESGRSYVTIGKYENSLMDLTKSIEIEPDNANTLRFRGETYRMLRRYIESLADLNKSLEIEPNDATSLRSRGNTYRIMGKYEESLADLNKSLRIEPNNTFALIIRANTYHTMDKYEKSLADLNVSLKN
ncbi:hypothetical protein C2G38_2247166 [Gigaspora rosea]|uniref:BACK domain-containing protein n=1 Tax=Gigaspora rosea TaxID=44941 RepID=A0A397V8A1_9GLOM|nr:hypothetical protein C2G38_2247166 [Gigaspora rosea]